eukprot:6666902-Prymnesium_polylepis.1
MRRESLLSVVSPRTTSGSGAGSAEPPVAVGAAAEGARAERGLDVIGPLWRPKADSLGSRPTSNPTLRRE